MNKELLLQVAAAIETSPKHFDMDDYFIETDCGTTACIAGWAAFIHSKRKNFNLFIARNNSFYVSKIVKKVESAIGIKQDSDKYDTLVLDEEWLRPDLAKKYQTAQTNEEKASAAAEYVRWFVRTDGGENLEA
jgi:hypothetical protein